MTLSSRPAENAGPTHDRICFHSSYRECSSILREYLCDTWKFWRENFKIEWTKHKWIYGEKSNPSAGETIKILHEDKADHSGVASDQIRPPAFEDANIFANFGHQSGVVLDEIPHENICLSSNAVVNTWKTNEGDDRLRSSLQQS